jgi:hypothetical protein
VAARVADGSGSTKEKPQEPRRSPCPSHPSWPERAEACTALRAVRGGTTVNKTVQLNGPLTFPFGRTNFNTDFTVSRAYGSYRIHFRSTSSEKGPYPIEAYLKFSDGSNLQVVSETLEASPGQARSYGPFRPPAGKLVTQVNVKVGSSYNANANATGRSYSLSVDGCP